MIASNRQNRPNMPKDYCPFCPSFGNVPDYEVLKYDNDFPALSQNPPEPDDVADDFFRVRPSYGKCEVILYSPGHTVTLPELSDEHMQKDIPGFHLVPGFHPDNPVPDDDLCHGAI